MKVFLRSLTFTILALFIVQLFFYPLVISDAKLLWIIILSLTLLNIFVKPILEIVNLPSKGPVFHLLSIILTWVMINILVAIIPELRFGETHLPGLLIIGFLIPSTYLTPFMSGILCAIGESVIVNYLFWLSSKK